ncbi:MAG: hypothetical protein ACQEQU_06490 [Spirochaetota bacterium]
MPSAAIQTHPSSYYPYTEGGRIWRTTTLTKKVIAYQRTGEDKEQTLQQLYYFVYSYPVDKHLLREEESSEFLLYFAPTIDYILHKFTFQGYPVEQYLVRCIRYRLRNFKTRQKAGSYEQLAAEHTHRNQSGPQDELETVFEEAPDYTAVCRRPAETPSIIIDASRFDSSLSCSYTIEADKLLYLVLKHALLLPHSVIPVLDEAFTALTSLFGKVSDMVLHLRTINAERLARYEKLEQQQNTLYVEMLHLEDLLRLEPHEHLQQEIIAKRCKKQAASRNVAEKIDSFNLYVYHRQIAELLGVPKGSIDSGLFYLRRKHKRLLDAFA